MPTFPIRRGGVGADVARLQNLLNRLGALLDEDGRFGGATDNAVRAFQESITLPVTGEVDSDLWNRLEALPEPSPHLPARGLTFIAREEVSSRERYDAVYCRPCWPTEDSGITIGVGYDLKFHDRNDFTVHWGQSLAQDTIDGLSPALGRTGSKELLAQVSGHVVPFEAAWSVFLTVTVPTFVATTRQAFPGYDALPPLCRSALVSLVYNRGPSMNGDRRVEMRAIRDLVAAGNLSAVPAQFEGMKHLWPDTRGLRDRRDREAALWRDGLQAQRPNGETA